MLLLCCSPHSKRTGIFIKSHFQAANPLESLAKLFVCVEYKVYFKREYFCTICVCVCGEIGGRIPEHFYSSLHIFSALKKKYGTLEFMCHPCTGVMLIFSVLFQF